MHEVKLPQLGQSVEEASIVAWLKEEGQPVKEGEPLYTVQTDKAEIECESPVSGTLRKILVQPDVFVPVLTVVALVGDPNEALPETTSPVASPDKTAAVAAPSSAATTHIPSQPVASIQEDAAVHAVSPRARRTAQRLGVDTSTVRGTGAGGRVMESDVEAQARRETEVVATPTARRIATDSGVDLAGVRGTGPRGKVTKADVAQARPQPAPVRVTPGRTPLTPMRRIIAERMASSKFSAPHYYVTIEVDMAEATRYRASVEAFKPSYNDLVMRATVRALEQHPQVNARWRGDAIEIVDEINLGFAVALESGLIVPVVRRIQTKSLEQIHEECKRLAEKARTGKLTPDDYSGSTFTISNLGGLGVDQFTAIINQPDSAILAVGQIKDRVVVIDGGIHIRPIMKLTLSSDHRVIDGAVAAQFMGTLKSILERANF